MAIIAANVATRKIMRLSEPGQGWQSGSENALELSAFDQITRGPMKNDMRWQKPGIDFTNMYFCLRLQMSSHGNITVQLTDGQTATAKQTPNTLDICVRDI